MNQEFQFRLDALRDPVTRRLSLSQAVHIDLPLLGGILVLMCVGLFVLYSGSGQSTETILKQMTRFALGFAVMVVMAQIPPRTYKRWTPWLYAIGQIGRAHV